MDAFNDFIGSITAIIWADWVLYTVLAVGLLFTLWSGICQYRALTHGVAVVRGKYDDKNDPGAINHFQALSAALSATVGLGNIAGVGVAVALGGPGAGQLGLQSEQKTICGTHRTGLLACDQGRSWSADLLTTGLRAMGTASRRHSVLHHWRLLWDTSTTAGTCHHHRRAGVSRRSLHSTAAHGNTGTV